MKIVGMALLALVVFMGYTNLNTTNAAQGFERDVGVQKSKAAHWKQKYDDLIQSGTCLDRMPKYEEVVG